MGLVMATAIIATTTSTALTTVATMVVIGIVWADRAAMIIVGIGIINIGGVAVVVCIRFRYVTVASCFGQRVLHNKNRPTPRACREWESARFLAVVLAQASFSEAASLVPSIRRYRRPLGNEDKTLLPLMS